MHHRNVLGRTLGIAPTSVAVRVVDGRITLRGAVERKSLVPVVVRRCLGVDGVVDVTADLDHRVDDISGTSEAALSRPARPAR